MISVSFALLIAAIFLSATLQAGTGFGFSVLATPLLLFFYPVPVAIQLNMFLSLLLSAGMFSQVKGHLDRTLLRRMIIAGVLALPLGIPLAGLDRNVMRLMVGCLLLALTLLLIVGPRVARSRPLDYVAGGLSAMMTTALGMPGPPLLVYLAGTDTEKAKVRAAALSFFIFIYTAGLALHGAWYGMSREVWKGTVILLPAVAAGMYAGQRLFHRISPRIFRAILHGVLAATAIGTLSQIR